MCWWKRKEKKQKQFPHSYKVGQRVNFKYRDDVVTGYIEKASLNKEGHVIYDIQIGGECPAIIYGVLEENIFTTKT